MPLMLMSSRVVFGWRISMGMRRLILLLIWVGVHQSELVTDQLPTQRRQRKPAPPAGKGRKHHYPRGRGRKNSTTQPRRGGKTAPPTGGGETQPHPQRERETAGPPKSRRAERSTTKEVKEGRTTQTERETPPLPSPLPSSNGRWWCVLPLAACPSF